MLAVALSWSFVLLWGQFETHLQETMLKAKWYSLVIARVDRWLHRSIAWTSMWTLDHVILSAVAPIAVLVGMPGRHES